VALDPNVKLLLDAMEQQGTEGLREVGLDQAREGIGLLHALGGTVDIARAEDRTIPGVTGDIPVRIYSAAADAVLPVVVYLHGGGWVIGDIASYDAVCRKLAITSGLTVISVDYRRAPEHVFPCAAEDAYAATRFIAEHGAELGVDGSRLAVAGDSAGGNLAAITAILARDRGAPTIAFQLLVYPVIDGTMSFPSYKENGEGYLLTADDMAWFYEQYVGPETDRRDPMLSPLYAADLSDLPPALVITAEYDPLRDEGEAYADALQQAGVSARASRYDGLVHGFLPLDGLIPAAVPAMEEAASALRNALA
jgi:acetyl esterase